MRRSLAGLIAAATCAGLYVGTWQPLAVKATALPVPGIITTYAGGGSGFGNPATIPQSPQNLGFNGTKLYIPDYQNFIRVVDLGTGLETRFSGDGITADTGDGGPASAAELKRPLSVSVDAQNNVFITTFDRVRKVTPAGIISTVAGAPTLVGPANTTSDAAGNLFIADEGAGLVRKVTPAGVISTVAGVGVCYTGCAPVPNGTAATSAYINPADVAIDGNGNLWIAAAQNNAIYRVDHVTGLVTTVAGGGAGCTQPCLATNQKLGTPVGLWLGNAGDFWIAEALANRVDRVDATGLITTVVGNPNSTNLGYGGDGLPATDPRVLLAYPGRPVTDAAGNLYFPDTQNYRVRKVDATTGIITTYAGNGRNCGGWGDAGPAAAAMLCSPTGLTTDSAGNLYLADGGRIREVNQSTGVITTVAGGGAGCAAPCPATSFQLAGGANFLVTGIAVDAGGDVFFQDGSRIYRVSGGTISVYAGNGTYGYSGDGGPAAAAALNGPSGIALDSSGNVFIADLTNNAIRRVDHVTQTITTYASVSFPVSLAFNSSGDLFFTYDNARSIGELPHSGGSVTLNLSVPAGSDARDVAVGPGDRVLVSARFGNTIYMLTTGAPVPLAGNGVYGFSGDGGPATSAQLHAPAQVTLDPSGDIFISSDQDPHVRRVQAYTLPDAPRAVAAVPGDNSAKVHWYAPAGIGGLPVTQYTVTPYAGATPGTPVVLNGTPLPTTYVATGLSNGTSYTFKVTATTAWGTSASSIASTPVTPGSLFQGYITTHAGSVGLGLGTSVAQLPLALALGPVETVGNGVNTHLYVGDWANGVVRDVNVTSGQEGVVAGTASYGYSGDGGPATAALMRGAGAVAYCNGSTYIADTFNYVIRKVDPNGVITTIVGTGFRGFNGDGVGTEVQITRVFGLICSGPYIWFSDSDSALVRQVDGVGHVTTLWQGFYFPTALLFDSQGTMYVTDTGSSRVWRLNYSQNPAIVAGGGPGCAPPPTECFGTQASLNSPRGIAIDSANGLYIADTNNNRVMYLTSGGFISTFASGLHAPRDIVLAPKSVGNVDLFIADFGSGQVLDADHTTPPVLTAVAGNGYLGLSGDGGPAASAQLGSPQAVAVDATGNQYVADPLDNAVRKIAPNGLITTIAGNGVLDSPQGLAVDAAQNIYISDGNHNRVLRVDHTSGSVTSYFASGLSNPSGLAFDPARNLYVSDTNNNRVLQVHPDGSSSVYVSNSDLKTPIGLWHDGSALYIADSGNNRVRMVQGGVITTVAGTGVAGFSGDGRAATLAQLRAPLGVAKDSSGNLYIADTFNQRIRIVDSHGNISTAIGICGGVAGFSGDSGPASTAQLNYPIALSVDGAATLYIADTSSSRLRRATGLAGARQASCQGVESTPGPRGTNSTGVSSSPGPRLIGGPASLRAPQMDIQPATRPTGEVVAPVRFGTSLPQLPPSTKAPTTSGSSGPPPASNSNHGSAGDPQATPRSAGAHVPTVPAIASRSTQPATPIPYQLVLFPLAVLTLAMLLGWRRFR